MKGAGIEKQRFGFYIKEEAIAAKRAIIMTGALVHELMLYLLLVFRARYRSLIVSVSRQNRLVGHRDITNTCRIYYWTMSTTR
jgi:hypothetical protein